MGIYDRYRREADGFRKLVELLESTPMKRRQELVDRGMVEDPEYTEAALSFVITFQEIVQLPEMELTEVICSMKPKNVAMAAAKIEEADAKERFLKCVPKSLTLEVHGYLDIPVSPIEAGGAKKEAILKARELERKGVLSVKKIPKNFDGKLKSIAGKKAPKKAGKTEEPIDLFGGKDLFTDELFGEKSDVSDFMIGKKKTGTR